ncbi:hypothetical protein RhiJN_23175 [Ceratobasidium sp. AG-Ba]|nr:hypothetical protein RhiJN_23175 [Ceratobasidium sp. AG-Ba]
MFPLQASFPPDSLAFIGVPKGLVMPTLAEAQATLAIRVMTGRVTLDFDHELSEARNRTEALRNEYDNSAVRVAQKWHKIIPYQPHTYDLVDLTWVKALDSRRVPDWQRNWNMHAVGMRKEWRKLERLGLTESWLAGIREGSIEDWVALMRRLTEQARIAE